MRKAIWFVFIALLGAGIVVAIMAGITRPGDRLAGDLDMLWSLGEAEGAERIVAKLNGSLVYRPDQSDFAEEARRIGERLAFPGGQILQEQGKEIYRAVSDQPNDKLQLTVYKEEDHMIGFVVEMAGEGQDGYRKVADRLRKQTERLRRHRIPYRWNATVQGYARNGGTADYDAITARIAKRVKMKEMERYTDETTVSATYFAPEIDVGIESGGKTVNLQIAVHDDREKDKSRISIGIPLITIEY